MLSGIAHAACYGAAGYLGFVIMGWLVEMVTGRSQREDTDSVDE